MKLSGQAASGRSFAGAAQLKNQGERLLLVLCRLKLSEEAHQNGGVLRAGGGIKRPKSTGCAGSVVSAFERLFSLGIIYDL